MKIEFRVIPGFETYEASACGKIRHAKTRHVKATSTRKRDSVPRVTLKAGGGSSTRSVEELVALAYGLPWKPRCPGISDEMRADVLRIVRRDPELSYAEVGKLVGLSEASVLRILRARGIANACSRHRRATYGAPIRGGDGPDDWSAVHQRAGKRDARMAAAGRFDRYEVPEWLLEKELRCLRRAPSRPPTHVPSSGSAAWAA